MKVRLTVLKGDKKHVTTPHFRTTSIVHEEKYYCTTGVDSGLWQATRTAVRSMVQYLQDERGLSAVEAYMLCSVAGDLRLHEVVRNLESVIGVELNGVHHRLICRTTW